MAVNLGQTFENIGVSGLQIIECHLGPVAAQPPRQSVEQPRAGRIQGIDSGEIDAQGLRAGWLQAAQLFFMMLGAAQVPAAAEI